MTETTTFAEVNVGDTIAPPEFPHATATVDAMSTSPGWVIVVLTMTDGSGTGPFNFPDDTTVLRTRSGVFAA